MVALRPRVYVVDLLRLLKAKARHAQWLLRYDFVWMWLVQQQEIKAVSVGFGPRVTIRASRVSEAARGFGATSKYLGM